jgi:serine protease AprX
MNPEDEPIMMDEEGPEPLTEDEMEAVRKAPKGGMGTSPNVKLIAIAIAIIVLGVIVWQVWFTAPDRSDWAYEMSQLDEANDAGYHGQSITVGVVDTGINADHKVFRDADIVKWRDFVNGRSEPYDDQGHGTAMTSLIAAQTVIPGGATQVDLIIAKVLNSEGVSTDGRVAKGIWFCIDPNGDGDYRDGADVISLSLGGRTSYLDLIIGTESQAAINEAVDSGIFVVAAAGNDGESDDGEVANPGRIRNVICVGAVDEDGRVAPFSSKGRNIFDRHPHNKPEMVAPGVDLVTAHYKGGYATGSGTSQATAMMAACLAVMLSAHPQLAHDGFNGGDLATVIKVKQAIMDTSRSVPGAATPHDDWGGYGLVQTMDLIDELA